MKWSQGGHQSEIFWILGLYIAGKFISDTLWLQRHSLHIVFLQRQQFFVELYNFIGSFMRLSFITQFKIEFLWPFTGCRKVLGKMPDTQNENNYISCAISLEQYIADDHDFCYTCLKWWYLQGFFHFWFLFFRVLGGKRAKNCPRWLKKFCLLNFIPQELYIIWSWLMVHMCKRIICPGVFPNLNCWGQ